MRFPVRGKPYADRSEAGRVLADALGHFAGLPNLVVLALPRGGVLVAAAVAAALAVPLDVVVVRKIGLPGRPELAMGAVAAVGDIIDVVRNEDVLAQFRVSEESFVASCANELIEVRRREHAYRSGRRAVQVEGRTVIVVDDGLATGATMRAAIAAIRHDRPNRVIAAIPIAAERTCARLLPLTDELICPWTLKLFDGVGQGYLDFSAPSDEQVRELLTTARLRAAAPAPGQSSATDQRPKS